MLGSQHIPWLKFRWVTFYWFHQHLFKVLGWHYQKPKHYGSWARRLQNKSLKSQEKAPYSFSLSVMNTRWKLRSGFHSIEKQSPLIWVPNMIPGNYNIRFVAYWPDISPRLYLNLEIKCSITTWLIFYKWSQVRGREKNRMADPI